MKKYMFYFAIALIILAFQSQSFAKNEEFRVLVSNGDIQVQKDGKGAWSKIKTGNYLYTKDILKLSSGAYLSMLHVKGRPVEIKKDGTYNVAQLAKELTNSKTKIISQLSNYVANQICDAPEIMSSGNYKKNMENTGAVERSINTESLSENNNDQSMPFPNNSNVIRICNPKKVSYTKQDLVFSWFKNPTVTEYEFILTDRFDRPEFSKVISDSTITINANTLKLSKDNYYFWKVKAASKPDVKSDEACFVVLSENKIEAINDTLKMLKSEMGNIETAPAKIIVAGFYEQNNLLEDANNSFKEAIKLAPGIDDYKKIYNEFLRRANFAKQ